MFFQSPTVTRKAGFWLGSASPFGERLRCSLGRGVMWLW
jgi:hypothetical protein